MTRTEIENIISEKFGINAVDFTRLSETAFATQSLETPFPPDKLPQFTTINSGDQNVPERLNTELGSQNVVWNEVERSLVITNIWSRNVIINRKRVRKTYRTIWTLSLINQSPVLQVYNEFYADLYSMNWQIISANSNVMSVIESKYINRFGGLRPEGGFEANLLINFMATSWRTYKNSPLQYKQEDLTCRLNITPAQEENVLNLSLISEAKRVPFVGSRTFIQINAPKKSDSLYIQRRTAKLSSDFNKRDCETVYRSAGTPTSYSFYAQENFTDANGNYVSAMGTGNLTINQLQSYNYYNE